MRKIIFAALLATGSLFCAAQNPVNPFPKTISVSGSAEMELIPDEIYVNVHLREYQKKGEEKTSLDQIKTQFVNNCRTAGVADSNISIQAYTGTNNYYWMRKRRKKEPEVLMDIVYQIKFRNVEKMDEVVDRLDDDATQYFNVARIWHSRMPEFRKQLKIQAVKAAKEKGIYLTEAINEKLGSAIKVEEPKETMFSDVKGNQAMSSNVKMQTNGAFFEKEKGVPYGDVGEIDFRKIYLRFEVDVLFAIQ